MSLFDQTEYTEFNNDRVVLHHEIGHVVVWFAFGEGIGPLTWDHYPDGLPKSHVALWPRSGGIERLNSSEYAKPYAERLLAGEIAARRALGKRTDQICSKGLPVEATSDHLFRVLDQIDDTDDLAKQDVVKVLKLAFNNAQSGWRAWFAERMGQADALVDNNWIAINRMAQKLERRLPRGEKPFVWTGGEMIAQMKRCGVRSINHRAVEIVFKGHSGSFVTRLKRFIQELGPNGIICRYEDDPSEQAEA